VSTLLAPALSAPVSPYKGLAPYEDSDLDAFLFFGREQETEVIAANLMASRITVLYGPSGVGKSSVLRAGVAHRLRREEEAEVVVFASWTDDPVALLVAALGGDGDSLADALAAAAERAGGELYLILDQFEECFLYHRDGGAFARQLADVVARPGLRVNVLIAIREEALARLDTLKASIPNLLANRLRLERLSRSAGAAAIVRPVLRYNELVGPDEQVHLELELEDRILEQVAAGRVELGAAGRGVAVDSDEGRIEAPYLQLVLSRLWDVERGSGSRTLRLATLRELGGAEHIVQDHLERAMATLSADDKAVAAAMYNFLVTPSGTKIAHDASDLAGYAGIAETEAVRVLGQLSRARIVRGSSGNGPASTRYEIFHDVLAGAVLAWRRRFQADSRLTEQRVRHERRQRQLLIIFGAALLALAVVAAIAVYAFAQRSEAQHQTAVARAEQAEAEHSARVAEKARAEARHAEQTAQARQHEAQRQAQRAEEQEVRAAGAAAAERSARERATAEARRAQSAEARAKTEAQHAKEHAAVARTQTKRALVAEARAKRQRNLVRAEKLGANARALLAEDPERSVRGSLAAITAYRLAREAPDTGVEDTLREGLLALRLTTVLPGGGPVRVTRFSPDGSLVLVAGKGGARLYDRSHRFRVLRLRPSTDLNDAAFSPDGLLVAGAGNGRDRAVHVWDARTGLQLYALRHDGAVLAVDFSPNGRFLATGSADGTARLWSVAGGLPLASFTHPPGAGGSDDVRRLSFSPDGSRLLTVGGDRFARVFDVERHVLIHALNHQTQVYSARFSHDGAFVATGGASELVWIWNASTGVSAGPALRGTGRVNDLAFSPDDTLLATAGGNDTVARVWNLEERSSAAIVTSHKSGVTSVTISPDGRSVVTTGRDGKAYITRTEGGSTQGLLVGHRDPVNAAAFSPDGKTIATASDDGTVRLWDARVDLTGPFPPATAREIGNHGRPVNEVGFSPDGRRVVSAGADGTAKLWGPGARVLTLRHDAPVSTASFGTDGTTVITGSDDGTARVWRASDGRLLSRLDHGAPVEVARLSPDSRIAVTAGRDTSVKLWNVRTGDLLERLEQRGYVNDARFSADGRLLVTAGADGTAAIWRVADGRQTAMLKGHSGAVLAAAFSPGGKRVVTASADFTARVWNVKSGLSEHELVGHTAAITAITFNPDGSYVATSSADSDARVWQVRSGKEIAVLRIHSGPVNDVAFSADGRWLATAGPQAAGVWEAVKNGRWPALPVYLIRWPTPRLDKLAFSPSGWRLVMGWRDGGVRTYDCRLCGTLEQLTKIGRSRLAEIVRVKS
jgi:WD40 repeat protein